MVINLSRLALCTLLLLAAVACGDGQAETEPPPPSRPAPPIVQTQGNFTFNGGAHELFIEEVPAGALGYRIGSLNAPDRMGVGLIGDPSQPWFFHNAADGSVWSYIAGVGVVHWTHTEVAGWKSRAFDQSVTDLPDNMPFVFYERLPTEEKSRWVPMPEN